MSAEVLVVRCGLVPYEEAEVAQRWLRDARQDDAIPDVLLLLEHPPVYTRGRRSDADELPMARRVVRDAGDRGARHRSRRPRHLPRAGAAGRLPDRRPEAVRRRRPRVRAAAGAGGDRLARRARRRRDDDRGPDRGLDRGRGAGLRRRPARGAQDRLDRGPRQPRRHHPRARRQRQQRPAAVRVGRAVRDRGLPGDLAEPRAGERAGRRRLRRRPSPPASPRSTSARPPQVAPEDLGLDNARLGVA